VNNDVFLTANSDSDNMAEDRTFAPTQIYGRVGDDGYAIL